MKTIKSIVLIGIGFAALASPRALLGRTLPADVIGMFPKNVSEFAYLDVRQVRTFSWFSQLEDQLLPPRFLHFENFLTGVGVNRDGRVEEIAWALVGAGAAAPSTAEDEDVVGVALGSFNPDSTQAYFQSQKLPVFMVHNLPFYGFGGGTGPTDLVFGFLDINTAAFGQRREVEKLIAARYGEEQGLFSNEQIAPLITRANGSAPVWMVLDERYTRLVVQHLVPQTAQFSQMQALFAILRALTIQITAGDEVEASFEAVCAVPNTADALSLAMLLKAGMVYQRYEIASSIPN